MAASEMATGAMTTEALLTAFKGGGGGALASNCAAPLSPGRNRSSAQFAATKEPPSTIAATTSQRKARERPNRRTGAVTIVDERVHGGAASSTGRFVAAES